MCINPQFELGDIGTCLLSAKHAADAHSHTLDKKTVYLKVDHGEGRDFVLRSTNKLSRKGRILGVKKVKH